MDELLLLRQLLLRSVRDARGGSEGVRPARLCLVRVRAKVGVRARVRVRVRVGFG